MAPVNVRMEAARRQHMMGGLIGGGAFPVLGGGGGYASRSTRSSRLSGGGEAFGPPEGATYEQLLQLDERGGGGAPKITPADLGRLTMLQMLTGPQLEVFKKNKDAECKICLMKYEVDEELRRLPCTHAFHKDCVDQHFSVGGKSNCPVCRHNLKYGQ